MPKVTVNGQTTYVKKITVGIPVASVNEAASGVVVGTGRTAGDILINNATTDLYSPGELQAGHGLTKYFDSVGNNLVLSVDSDEIKSIIDSNYNALVSGSPFIDSAYFDSNLQALQLSLIPYTDSTYDLGSPTKKFRRLYLSGNTIVLGNLNIGDESGTFAVRDSDGVIATFDLSGNTTTDLTEGNNLYYTRARFDSALGDTTSSAQIRTYFDSALGDTTSTQSIRGYINAVDAGGDGSFTYDSSTGQLTYTGPSAAEVRAHFSAGGDLSYDSNTGQFTFDVEQVYTKANFDSDLGDANTDQLPEGSSNLYYSNALVTSHVDSNYIAARIGGPFVDSAYVSTAISNLVDGAPGALDTLNELAAALNDDSDAFNTLLSQIDALPDSAQVQLIIDQAYIRARQITYNTSDFADSAYVQSYFSTNVPRFGTDYIDSATASAIIIADVDSNYIASKIGGPFIDSDYFDTNIPKFGTDYVDSAYVFTYVEQNSLDSERTISLIDSSYIQARQQLVDSASIIALVDSNYIAFRIGGPFVDSAYVEQNSLDSERTISLIDSAYVQARQQLVDSASIFNLIDSNYIAAKIGGPFIDSAYFDTNIPKLGTDYVDSAQVVLIVDSDYLTQRVKSLEGDITITTTQDDAVAGPSLILDRNTASAADSDIIGEIIFKGQDDAAAEKEYAKISAYIDDATAATPAGAIDTQILDGSGYIPATRLSKDGFEVSSQIPFSLTGAFIYQGATVDSNWVGERAKQIISPEIKYIDLSDSSTFGPKLILDRNSASPVDSDAIGMVEFRGRNSVDSEISYASIETFINDPSADSEDGEIQFHIVQSGFDRTKLTITKTGIELGINENLIFQTDSYQQSIQPGSYTADHTLTLPDSTGTLLTVDHMFNLIDSSYIGARQGATGVSLTYKDRDSNEFTTPIIQSAIITAGAPISFGNTVTVLLTDSSEFTISL